MAEKSRASGGFVGFRIALAISIGFFIVHVETKPSELLQATPCSVWWRYICFFCAEPPLNNLDRDSLISLCASQITEGNISESVKTFKKINNDSSIVQIVERVYSKDRDANLIRLIQFATKLQPTQQNIVYVNIYWSMVANVVDIVSPGFLVLASQWTGQNLDLNHQIVYKYQVQFLKNSWAQAIRNSDLEPHKSTSRQIENLLFRSRVHSTGADGYIWKTLQITQIQEYLSQRCESYLEPIWAEIIEEAYGRNVSSIKYILAFVGDSEFNQSTICPVHKISIIEALRKHMIKFEHVGTEEFVQVAYYLKAEMERVKTSCSYKDRRVCSLWRYAQIKERFPWKIQNLVWDGRSCLIMSVTYSEYLYTELPTYNRYDEESGSVFTRISNQPPTRMFWNVESKDIHSVGRTVTVYNVNIGKNLFSKERNGIYKVSYWIPEGDIAQEKWIIQPSDDGEMFLIKNFYDGRYLSASQDKHDSFRRNVVTSGQKHYWKVEC